MTSYKEKLKNVSTFIFDIDGVFTNGDITLYEDQVVRTLNSRDCYALQYATKLGYRALIITGGESEPVRKRLLGLGAKEVCMGAKNKLHVYDTLKSKYEFNDEEVIYLGDDIPDFHVMRTVGVAACPQDATPEIKSISDYQSPFNGGRHCVRDIIEQTLRVQGKWFSQDAFEW
ncbi:MAG: HAD hydrolase family protein [Crocinitomicaceae bacterium]|nr:HAD hydrolase family protein [Crocinitomicaceae bacterium]